MRRRSTTGTTTTRKPKSLPTPNPVGAVFDLSDHQSESRRGWQQRRDLDRSPQVDPRRPSLSLERRIWDTLPPRLGSERGWERLRRRRSLLERSEQEEDRDPSRRGTRRSRTRTRIPTLRSEEEEEPPALTQPSPPSLRPLRPSVSLLLESNRLREERKLGLDASRSRRNSPRLGFSNESRSWIPSAREESSLKVEKGWSGL